LEGEDVQVGDVSLRVIDTPGHSRGHVSYLLNDGGASSLFSGDVIFPRGRIVLQNIWDCSIQDYADSIAKLQQFQVNRLYPGHGPFLLNRAADHIEMAQRYFE